MRTAPRLRTVLHRLGSALALIGIVFVVHRIGIHADDVDWSRVGGTTLVTIALFAAIYGAANLMLGAAWWHLLAAFGAHVPRRWAQRAYGSSQLAKYVPGNVFHLASRQMLGMAAGIGTWPLVRSISWEMGLLCVAGATIGLLALPMQFAGLAPALVGVAFFSVVVLVVVALRFTVGLHAALAFAWQLGFLAIMGALAAALTSVLAPGLWLEVPAVDLASAYVGAWLIGMITPGAPAGMGVRELTFLALVHSQADRPGLLLVLVVMRLITVGGDLAFYLGSTWSTHLEKNDAA